jgi:hypothetical protein
MAKLTIIVEDSSVVKDGVGRSDLDLSSCNIPSGVSALQWSNTEGEIEFDTNIDNEHITELPEWAVACENVWLQKESKVEEEPLPPTTETFWDSYPEANALSVDTILLNTYPGVTNVRGVDPKNVVKSVETTVVAEGATALASLQTLLDDCKSLGVPVTSDPFGSDVTQNFKDYMVGLGYTLYSGVNSQGQEYEKIYYPWSQELEDNKHDQDVNEAREKSLKAGVEWNNSNWQIDLDSRNNVMNMLVAIASGVYTGTSVTWRNTANVDVELTIEEFKQLAAAVNTKVEEIYLASFSEKA